MAHSGIHYGGKTVIVKDWDIAQLLRSVGLGLAGFLKEQDLPFEWLAHACLAWMDDFDNSAPGVRDLELDEVIVDERKKSDFIAYLRWLRQQDHGSELDAQAAGRAIDETLKLLAEPKAP